MTKYLLINGPAGVGKDTLGQLIAEYLTNVGETVLLDKFAAPLKKSVGDFLDLTAAERKYYFETPEKNKPQDRFHGATPRQALINFSEAWAKPTFGQPVFAKKCVERNAGLNAVVVVTDCGFTIEADVIYGQAESGDVMLVALERDGLTFESDSREYIMNRPRVRISTDSDVMESHEKLKAAVNEWLGL